MEEEEFIKKYPKGKIFMGVYYFKDVKGKVICIEDEKSDFELERVIDFIIQNELRQVVLD